MTNEKTIEKDTPTIEDVREIIKASLLANLSKKAIAATPASEIDTMVEEMTKSASEAIHNPRNITKNEDIIDALVNGAVSRIKSSLRSK